MTTHLNQVFQLNLHYVCPVCQDKNIGESEVCKNVKSGLLNGTQPEMIDVLQPAVADGAN